MLDGNYTKILVRLPAVALAKAGGSWFVVRGESEQRVGGVLLARLGRRLGGGVVLVAGLERAVVEPGVLGKTSREHESKDWNQ